ncbi:anthranilate synthase component I [Ectobacillus antri]|uniref:Anthranilate synthase component 1 n=1 Tax=Ectobacillus antri TaxID=2486280 RepID=A0ABT6HAN9_9BACI|nr:anthranilate synthase component I [Ectobacillus antri]MDG4658320.1 anthranilate synthase component I [Ectobacillus antri]MDG5755591.1 anthranilate synthase component I [Ectobacillus antri]
MMTKETFDMMRNQKQLFFITDEMEGDEVTPIVLYQRLAGNKTFLLESSLTHEDKGRYSFIGSDPYMEITSNGKVVNIISGTDVEQRQGKVLDVIRELLAFQKADSPFPFAGGAIGYVGYDVIRQYEEIGTANNDELEMPETHLLFYQAFTVYDHKLQKVSFVYVYRPQEETSYEQVQEMLTDMKTKAQRQSAPATPVAKLKAEFHSNIKEDEFYEMVNRAKEYIKAGDIFQVVLSQRLRTIFDGDPFGLYRRLRITNPSPYMFYVDFGSYTVLGSSPESLLSVKGDKVITNPIAGTRPRGRDKEEDEKIAKELRGNEKEKAEHLMLVDLGRNDLGLVSEIGTVKPEKFMEIERYSHVMHLVSEVSGQLREGVTCLDALQYCLPAGTVSGAPKIRAMTIIDELENKKRGVYAGTVGYISFNGDMDMALAIRTMVVKDNKAYIQAGAGIVYDSEPEAEYMETINKAKALLEVLS